MLLDSALGGGYAKGRVINIVGDKSTGKTLLAIEACNNFARSYPKGKIRYKEAESAFDVGYASTLGLDLNRVEIEDTIDTIEETHEDLKKFAEKLKDDGGLYVIDSADALTDKEEMEREMGEATFGVGKAKRWSELFRRDIRKLGAKGVTLIIISQVRSNIGVTFGKQYTRSGGKALDFYSSQIIWLSDMGKIKKVIGGIERVVGVKIKAKIEKNKCGFPFREVAFEILFGFGIDDVASCYEWLGNTKTDITGFPADKHRFEKHFETLDNAGKRRLLNNLRDLVRRRWEEVESQFTIKRKKYIPED